MLEIHLFINPLGQSCLASEKDVLTISQRLATKVSYQFVPLVNMQTIQDTLVSKNEVQCSLQRRAQVAGLLYQVAADYKAALCQGGLRGRKFLMNLQNALLHDNTKYDKELVQKIAKQVGIDWESFIEDRQSADTKKCLMQDRIMADSLGVRQTGTAVVCDTNNPEYALLINNFTISSLLECVRQGQLKVSQQSLHNWQQSSSNKLPHLHLH